VPVTGARVFVVDDDPAITQIYDEVLKATGYDVVTAGSCGDAMAKLDAIGGDVQVLVVDLGLPDGDGADFVRDAAAKYGSAAGATSSGRCTTRPGAGSSCASRCRSRNYWPQSAGSWQVDQSQRSSTTGSTANFIVC